MQYAIVIRPVAAIYQLPAEVKRVDGVMLSAVSDEGLHGMGLAVVGEERQGFLPVRTFYGYTGYIRKEEIRLVSLEEMMGWEEGGLMVTTAFCLDVMSVPRVQGVRLITLYRGSLLRVIPFECGITGWVKVQTADGRFGYVREQYLENKEFSQAGLWMEELPQKKIVDEGAFRKGVADTALTYLGTQYRWGGRSTAGIDCSGLTSVSYLLNGIITYRDAELMEGYPVHAISRNCMKTGDLLYFPGHIAMYLGDGSFIHSTGRIGSGGVVINSLRPEAEDYRADLAESLYAVGSMFGGKSR